MKARLLSQSSDILDLFLRKDLNNLRVENDLSTVAVGTGKTNAISSKTQTEGYMTKSHDLTACIKLEGEVCL